MNIGTKIILLSIHIFFIPLIFIVVLFSRLKSFLFVQNKINIFLGTSPIINFSNYSVIIKQLGFFTKTFVTHCFIINKEEEWDVIMTKRMRFIIRPIKYFLYFIYVLYKYDIFITTYRGLFIGSFPFGRFQFNYLKYAGKKTIVIAYGSDSYVYRRISLPRISHCLQTNYGPAAKLQNLIAKNLDHITQIADAVIPSIMYADGFGRWDILTPCPFFLDLNSWITSKRNNNANGIDGEVVVAHSPNHRGVKGTEYLLEAIKILKDEGLKVTLKLYEGVPNEEIKKDFANNVDILVEQLNGYGYALSGLEGMASGLPVISSDQDNIYVEPFRIWSFFDECPIVGSSCLRLVKDLRHLIMHPNLRIELGKAGRAYAEKYHGYDSGEFFFSNLFDYINGKRESIINLYHPILGEYPNRSPKIKHPLVNNRIVDKSW